MSKSATLPSLVATASSSLPLPLPLPLPRFPPPLLLPLLLSKKHAPIAEDEEGDIRV